MNSKFYITDEQIAKAKEKGACKPALEWAEKERDWRKISDEWLMWDAVNTKLCPAEALIELSKDSDVDIRYSVARHSNTPVETLIELSKRTSRSESLESLIRVSTGVLRC